MAHMIMLGVFLIMFTGCKLMLKVAVITPVILHTVMTAYVRLGGRSPAISSYGRMSIIGSGQPLGTLHYHLYLKVNRHA